MPLRALIGTRKGAFLATSDGDRTSWSVEGPLFKGWEVTAAHRLADGDYLVATASHVYGAAIHRGPSLDALEQVVDGPAHPDDGGRSWVPRNRGVEKVVPDESHDEIGFCVHGLAADSDDPDRIWQQNHRGMYRTADGSDSWQKIHAVLPSTFGFPIARDPVTARLFSVPLESDEYRLPPGGALRVYVSDDDGESWEPRLPGPHHYNGVLRGAMALDRLDPCGVYLGTTGGTVHVSRDGGAGGERSVRLDARSLGHAPELLLEERPALRVHLYDEEGDFREHVHCFHNEANTQWLPSLDRPLRDGDEIVVIQAVSGG